MGQEQRVIVLVDFRFDQPTDQKEVFVVAPHSSFLNSFHKSASANRSQIEEEGREL